MAHRFSSVPTTEPDRDRYRQAEPEDDDTLCGIGKCKPSWLQRFADPKFYLIVYCIVGVIEGAHFTYFVGVLTTLEKRFAFESKVSGIILIADNISGALLSLILGYYGGKWHKPRLIAFGMVMVALSSFLCTIPYFMYGPALHLLTRETFEHGNKKEYCDSIIPEVDCERTGSFSMMPAVIILFVANFIWGFGNTAYYIIGTPYLDDNVRKKNAPMYFSRYN